MRSRVDGGGTVSFWNLPFVFSPMFPYHIFASGIQSDCVMLEKKYRVVICDAARSEKIHNLKTNIGYS